MKISPMDKKRVGRPKKSRIKERKAVCIHPEVYDFFVKLGNGNFSAGIELAYNKISKKLN
jgi:hypothetical protein